MSDKKEPTIGHICPSCINAVFWVHRNALDKVLDVANTPGEDTQVKYDGMVAAAFECLSFFDGYYDGCLHYKTGTLKDHEVWIKGKEAASTSVRESLQFMDAAEKEQQTEKRNDVPNAEPGCGHKFSCPICGV